MLHHLLSPHLQLLCQSSHLPPSLLSPLQLLLTDDPRGGVVVPAHPGLESAVVTQCPVVLQARRLIISVRTPGNLTASPDSPRFPDPSIPTWKCSRSPPPPHQSARVPPALPSWLWRCWDSCSGREGRERRESLRTCCNINIITIRSSSPTHHNTPYTL